MNSGVEKHPLCTNSRPLKRASLSARITLFFLSTLLISALVTSRWIETGNITIITSASKSIKPQLPFSCAPKDQKLTCPAPITPQSLEASSDRPSSTCPEYFRWIHEDLRLWKSSGISREMVESAKTHSHFRLVVVNGRIYIDRFKKSYQTRDVFTIWGIVQLLRLYPGRLPDLDLMFNCNDKPAMRRLDFIGRNVTTGPPPLFRYCADKESLDIVFPDWSFWGWPEINIKPWEALLKDMRVGNNRIKWEDREPYAYWKGNPTVAPTRRDLLKCNVSEKQDWNARLFTQDWRKEQGKGFKESNLADQCDYRYKIYIEGNSWSVSEKYILACNSPTLLVTPRYHDFFTRGLMPDRHYWPIRDSDKCSSVKFAVDWGNSHEQEAQAVGKASSSFIQEEVKMDYVYDYMFHLLNEYSKLLTYYPTKPKNAFEVCSESMSCLEQGLQREFMMLSMVNVSSSSSPCTLLPPFYPSDLQALLDRNANLLRQIEIREERAWDLEAQKAKH